MDLIIRHLGAGDAGLLARVAPDVFDAAIDPARAQAYLADASHHLIVAIVDGEVVGQCAAVVHRHVDLPTELYVDNLGVTPALQRRGIARQLLDAMYAWGAGVGCTETWVGTETDNAPARALYRSYGVEAETFALYLRDL